jgi:hypothetical protein
MSRARGPRAIDRWEAVGEEGAGVKTDNHAARRRGPRRLSWPCARYTSNERGRSLPYSESHVGTSHPKTQRTEPVRAVWDMCRARRERLSPSTLHTEVSWGETNSTEKLPGAAGASSQFWLAFYGSDHCHERDRDP